MSTTSRPQHGYDHVPTEELIRRQGVRPPRSPDELAREDAFSDEECAGFLAELCESRPRALAFIATPDLVHGNVVFSRTFVQRQCRSQL